MMLQTVCCTQMCFLTEKDNIVTRYAWCLIARCQKVDNFSLEGKLGQCLWMAGFGEKRELSRDVMSCPMLLHPVMPKLKILNFPPHFPNSHFFLPSYITCIFLYACILYVCHINPLILNICAGTFSYVPFNLKKISPASSFS